MEEQKNTEQQAQTEPSSSPTPVSSMPENLPKPVLPKVQRKFPLLPIAILLIIISLGAAGVLAYQNYQLNQKLSKVSYTPASSSPSPTNDPTADWRSYTDPVNSAYSFKYPNNFTLPGDKEVNISLPLTGNPNEVALAADGTTWKLGTDAPFDGFNVSVVTLGNLSFDNFVVNEVNAEKNSPRGILSTQTYKMTVDGQPAAYIESEANIRRYFILNKDNKTAIVFSTATRSESFLKIMDQILSTFKFK